MSYKDDFQQGMDRGIELFGGAGARFLFYVIAGGYVLTLANQAAVSPPVVLTAILTSIGPNLMSGLIDKFKDGKGFDKKQLKQLEETLNKAVEGHEEELLAFFEHNQDFLNKILKNQDWMVQIIDGGIDEIVGEISKSSVKIDEVLTIVSSTDEKVDALKEAVDLAVQMMLYGTHNKSKPKVLLDTRVGKNIVLFATFGTIGQAGNYQPGEDWANLISGNLYTLLRENDIRVIALSTEVSSIGEAYDLLDEYNAQAIIWGKIAQSYIRFECTIDSRYDEMFPVDFTSFRHEPSGQMSYQAYIEHYSDVEYIFFVVGGILNVVNRDYEVSCKLFSRALLYLTTENQYQLGIASIHVLRGLCFTHLEDTDSAFLDYNEAIRLDPNLAIAYNNRGCLYIDSKEYDAALLDFNESIKADPLRMLAYCNRGYLYIKIGRGEEAATDLTQAINMDPESPEPLNNRGVLYGYLGRHKDALVDFDEAIRLKPDKSIIFYNRGSVYAKVENFGKAVADLTYAIQLDPELSIAYQARGLLYLKNKELVLALKDLDNAVFLDPNCAGTYNNRGLTYTNLSRYEEALADFDKAIGLDDKNVEFIFNRTSVYSILKMYDVAMRELNRIIMLKPEFAEAHKERGYLSLSRSLYKDALKDFEKYQSLVHGQDPFIRNEIYRLRKILRR